MGPSWVHVDTSSLLKPQTTFSFKQEKMAGQKKELNKITPKNDSGIADFTSESFPFQSPTVFRAEPHRGLGRSPSGVWGGKKGTAYLT